jgi:hypothetical protein
VTWATTETVQCLLEKPIFARLSVGITRWRTDDGDFLRGQNAITEGILAIALFEYTTLFDSQTDKVPEGLLTKNWCVTLRFRQERSTRLPRMTMRDFARSGMRFSSFLMVRTHMVGMALGAPFSRKARYSLIVRRWKVPILSIEPFSS